MMPSITTTKVDGGVVAGPRGASTPQSRAGLSVSVSVRTCELEGCDKPLTGRQRAYCSDSHRAMASRQRRQDAAPKESSFPTRPAPDRLSDVSLPAGSRRPAHSLIPKHSSSRGAEAVDLMRRAGVDLDGWQQDVLRVPWAFSRAVGALA